MTNTDLRKFTAALTDAVNAAHADGMTPKELFEALAGAIAAIAFSVGADDEDVHRLFSGFAYGFRPKQMPLPNTEARAEVCA